MAFEYGRVLSPADLAAFRALALKCFNLLPDYWEPFERRMGTEDLRLLRDGPQVVATLAFYRLGQWFAGRSVPMAGVAAVTVAPERRGGGCGEQLMAGTLRELRAAGFPLSALFASTQSLYRKVGYEQAGHRVAWAADLALLPAGERDLPARSVECTGPAPFAAMYQSWSRGQTGVLQRSAAIWDRTLHPQGEPTFAYAVGPEEAPEGYLVAQQKSGGAKVFDLELRDFVALTARAERRLWSLLADHRSVCGEVRWGGPANEPHLASWPEQGARVVHPERWMLRMVDVPSALAQRGWPVGESGELHLEIEDEVLPENSGRWTLWLEQGRARVDRGGRGELRAHARGLAPLYSGLYGPAELQRLGLLDGAPVALETAARLFVGPEPWMPDFF